MREQQRQKLRDEEAAKEGTLIGDAFRGTVDTVGDVTSTVTSTVTSSIGINKGPDQNGVKTQSWYQNKKFKSFMKIAGLVLLALTMCLGLGFFIYKFFKPVFFNHKEKYGDLEISG